MVFDCEKAKETVNGSAATEMMSVLNICLLLVFAGPIPSDDKLRAPAMILDFGVRLVIIKKKWLKTYDEVSWRDDNRIIVSWDIALSEMETADYAACVVLLARGEVFFVFDVDFPAKQSVHARHESDGNALRHRPHLAFGRASGGGNTGIGPVRKLPKCKNQAPTTLAPRASLYGNWTESALLMDSAMDPDHSATVERLCRNYLAAMESGDLAAVLANFTDDATATSPISGQHSVRDFYAYVMRVTSDRSIALRTIFVGASDPSRAAVHVNYTRTVGNGKPSTIEAVDVFELTEDRSKFAAVTIIYDTAPVRSDFKRLGAEVAGREDKYDTG